MTYQEFKTNTLHAISAKLDSSYRVALQDIIKNNDTHLDGLTILSENSNISPTFYLNYYYGQYLSGKDLAAICDDILLSYHKNVPAKNIDISFFTDFKQAKEHIIFKLINYERNKELLTSVPYIRYLDLAIVFCCFVDSSPNGYATILIHKNHLSFWNISTEELYAFAINNTPRLLPQNIQNMSDVLSELFCDNLVDSCEIFHEIPMYVLSNTSKLNGAGCILYEDLLADFSQKINSDFYIIPSSIHEVLLISSDYSSYEELTSMVNEVNATQVTKEEILSDHVYFYSRETGQVTV